MSDAVRPERDDAARIRTVLHQIWAPIPGAPLERYDAYVGPLRALLKRGAERSEIKKYLNRITVDELCSHVPKRQLDEAVDWIMQLLPFQDLAADFFDPVAARYGMALTASRRFELCYESSAVGMAVFFGSGRDNSLEVHIEQLRSNAPAADLYDILRLKNEDVPERLHWITAYTAVDLRTGLRRLAELTLSYADEFLRNDAAAFAAFRAYRTQKNEEYNRNLEERQRRR